MKVVYHSVTGNIPRFLAKCGIEGGSIAQAPPAAGPFILVTNTLGFGEVPPAVSAYLAQNGEWLWGVAASGNRNFGGNFGAAGRQIAEEYNVPLLLTFELAGTNEDVQTFCERLWEIDAKLYRAK
ncbi:class Ib ribonucleoside-diphosphate reductase assembly flavoprotein NrdI [Salibacterium aidingense]|uniref:class Ib ribonucleoside-diphosphate reductase assembly flavoprotein NrdI n=1 Tax=Salibacterium aidingense TaxID=384933 RepID=UPI003BEB03DA